MKVFLSYTAVDQKLAGKFADRLRSDGLTVWDPAREIYPGDNWAKSIGEALDTSDAMVVIVSPESATSEFVRRDISFAAMNQRYAWRLIPVYTPSLNSSHQKDLHGVLDRVRGVHLRDLSAKSLTNAVDEVKKSLAATVA